MTLHVGTALGALHSTIMCHMSEFVRPTPSAQWLAQQPLVSCLANLIEVILADTDGRVVTPGVVPWKFRPGLLVWDHLEECFRVDLHHAAMVVPVTHLDTVTAVLIIC